MVHTNEEVEIMSDNATPRKRDVQASDSDGDVKIIEPYKTPIVLQRQKKKLAPGPVNLSEAEMSEIENQQRKRKKGNKKKGQVCSFHYHFVD